MRIGRGMATFTFLLMLVLLVTSAAGCVKKKPAASGGTVTQPAAPVSTPDPSPGTSSGGMLQSGSGDRSSPQTSQQTITYGAYALWTGKWETTFFRYGGTKHTSIWDLKQVESKVTGTYDWDNGRLDARQSKTSGLMIGTWLEAPSYKPPDDAGDIELQQAIDGNSFTGKWRYGSSGDWIGEWNGKRIR